MYVTNTTNFLRHTVTPDSPRDMLLSAAQESLSQYLCNLRSGNIQITTVADLERIARVLTVLSVTTPVETMKETDISPAAPEVLSALDSNGEAEQEVFNKLFRRLNEVNNKV